MATNAREQVDLGLVNRLEVSSLIQKVTREFVGFDLESGGIENISRLEMPAVIVNTGNEVDISQLAGGVTRIRYAPEIVGYVYDEDEYFSELNELIAEVKNMLFSDRRILYNSACIGSINGLESVTTDRGRLAPYGAFSMVLDITFDYQTSTGGQLT